MPRSPLRRLRILARQSARSAAKTAAARGGKRGAWPRRMAGEGENLSESLQ